MTDPINHTEPYPGDITLAENPARPCGRQAPNGGYKCGREQQHPGAHAAGDGTYTRAIWTGAADEWHAWPNPQTTTGQEQP